MAGDDASPPRPATADHHCFYATLSWDKGLARADEDWGPTIARTRTPYCDTVLLTSARGRRRRKSRRLCGIAASRPRRRRVSADYSRRCRGGAATRLHGIAASRPQRRRDSSPRTTQVRSIWLPRPSCWLLCVAIGLWATTCPAPSVPGGAEILHMRRGQRTRRASTLVPSDYPRGTRGVAATAPPTGRAGAPVGRRRRRRAHGGPALRGRAVFVAHGRVQRPRRVRGLDQRDGRGRCGRGDAVRAVSVGV